MTKISPDLSVSDFCHLTTPPPTILQLCTLWDFSQSRGWDFCFILLTVCCHLSTLQTWDEELERSAAAWAQQCLWEHGPASLLVSIGQNLAVHWGR